MATFIKELIPGAAASFNDNSSTLSYLYCSAISEGNLNCQQEDCLYDLCSINAFILDFLCIVPP